MQALLTGQYHCPSRRPGNIDHASQLSACVLVRCSEPFRDGFWTCFAASNSAVKGARWRSDCYFQVRFECWIQDSEEYLYRSPVSNATPSTSDILTSHNSGNVKVDCLDCFVSGTFQLTGHVAVKGGQLTALNLIALPQNVAATLQMRASLTAKKPVDKLSAKYPVLSVPVPGAGIGVKGIFTLGATVSYDLAISSSFKGTSEFDFGLRAKLPGTAKVVADAVNSANSAATGFDGYSSQPNFGVHSLTAGASISANTVPKLAFGIDVVNVGRVEVSVSMKLPDVSATLSAEYSEFLRLPSTSVSTLPPESRLISTRLRRGRRVRLPKQ